MGSEYISNVLNSSTEDLVTRNGATLLASLFQQALRLYRDALDRTAAERRELTQQLSEAQRIGILVLKAQAEGRKTVRVAELVAPAAGKVAA